MPKKILIVDDEPDTVELAKMVLSYEGYETTIAYDGEEALEKVHVEIPDLVLLDIKLPKKTGLEVCKELKQDPKYKHVPILMFTAKAHNRDLELGWEAGADDYITKPFSGVALLERIRTHLDKTPHKEKEEVNT
ncbi:MAG: response regulator transcription factor [Candidatus Heimdallarchaeota archaeon]